MSTSPTLSPAVKPSVDDLFAFVASYDGKNSSSLVLTEETKVTLLSLFTNFIQDYKDISVKFSETKEQTISLLTYVIKVITTKYEQDQVLTLTGFTVLKLISRGKKYLTSTLYQINFLNLCGKVLTQYANNDELVIEIIGLFSNLASIDRNAFYPLITSETSTILITTIKQAKTRSTLQPALRLLFVLAINAPLATTYANEYKIQTFILDILLEQVPLEQQIVNNNNDTNAKPEIDQNQEAKFLARDEFGNAKRHIISACYRVLYALTLHSAIPDLKQALTEDQFGLYGRVTSKILSIGTEITQEDRKEFAVVVRQYSEMFRERDGITPAVVPPAEEEDNNNDTSSSTSPPPLVSPTETERSSTTTDSSSTTSPLPPVYKAPVFEEDTDLDEKDPSKCTPNQVRIQVVNLLSHSIKDLVPYLMDDLRGFKALTRLLYRAALQPADKLIASLAPLLMSLQALAKESKIALALLKQFVFGSVAFDNTPATEKSMKSAGHTDNPYALRTLLIKNLTSFNTAINRLSGEFLYTICENSSEYIRLTGFGNAVGLLANKGMPGFTGFTENALSIRDLQKMSDEVKKRKEKRGE